MSTLAPSSTVSVGPRWAASDAWTIALRTMSQWRRQPWAIGIGLVFPIMLIVINAFIYGGAMTLPGGGNYREFLMPGMFAMTMMFGLAETALAVSTDSDKGVTDRFRSMPMAPSAVVVGRSLADAIYASLQLVIMVLGGLLMGWEWNRGAGRALAALGLLVLLRFAIVWVGIYLGIIVRSPEAMSGLQIVVFPVGFLSSAFVSPESMPRVLQVLAEWNPLSSTAVAARSLFGNPGAGSGSWVVDHATMMAVLWPLAIIAIFLPLSVRAYRNLGR